MLSPFINAFWRVFHGRVASNRECEDLMEAPKDDIGYCNRAVLLE